jgi:hypothetical protein
MQQSILTSTKKLFAILIVCLFLTSNYTKDNILNKVYSFDTEESITYDESSIDIEESVETEEGKPNETKQTTEISQDDTKPTIVNESVNFLSQLIDK